MSDPEKAAAWRSGWLAGNRWAFSERDVDDIKTNPYGPLEHTHETGGAWNVTRWQVEGCPACNPFGEE